MTIYWHPQGNSQEENAGGSDYAHSFIKLYQAGTAVPDLVLLDNYFAGSTYWPDFKTQQSTILANKVAGHINVVTMRPGTVPTDAFFDATYGDPDGWAADVLPVFATYRANGFKVVPMSSLLGSAPDRRYVMDGILRSWVGAYTDGFCDMSFDPINSDDVGSFAAHPNEFQPDGHLKDPGQVLVYSYFKPAMDRALQPSWFNHT